MSIIVKNKSQFKKLRRKTAYVLKGFIYKVQKIKWLNIILIFISIIISYIIYRQIKNNSLFDTQSTLTNILTINGVFSAILITYLFSRITWTKERKLEVYNEAVNISQKITDFRRILEKLTRYYGVWRNDSETKSLLDFNKFKHIDYYDYNLVVFSSRKLKDSQLIEELRNHKNFAEGVSNLYLAMVSLVKDRKREWYWQQELYKDFDQKGIYNLRTIEKWMECDIVGTIWYWLPKDANQINYYALTKEKDYILAAAIRINKKYDGSELNNELIRELADDINNHYLGELHSCLLQLKKGVQDLSLLILLLISFSLFFGVLIPFALLLFDKTLNWYIMIVEITAAINAGLIAFFLMKFPFLINKEVKWI